MKRSERSDGPDTALYKNYLFFICVPTIFSTSCSIIIARKHLILIESITFVMRRALICGCCTHLILLNCKAGAPRTVLSLPPCL